MLSSGLKNHATMMSMLQFSVPMLEKIVVMSVAITATGQGITPGTAVRHANGIDDLLVPDLIPHQGAETDATIVVQCHHNVIAEIVVGPQLVVMVVIGVIAEEIETVVVSVG